MSNENEIQEYSVYTSLINTAISLVLSLISLKYCTRVLFIKTFRVEAQKLSPVIITYFIYLSFWCLITVIESIYYLLYWRPDKMLHNGTLLYLFGIFPWFCLYLNPVIDIFLAIDRCLAIIYPLQQSKRTKYFLTFIMAISMPLLIFIGFDQKLLISMCTEKAVAECQSFTCVLMLHKNFYNMKLRFYLTILNAFCGILLIFLLTFYHKLQNEAIRNATKAVIIIVGFTVIFDVIPNIIAQIFTDFILMVIKYVGTFAATLNAVNICFCSIYYSKAICKSFIETPPHTTKMVEIQKY